MELQYFQMQGIECLVTKCCGSPGNTCFSVAKQESKQKGKDECQNRFPPPLLLLHHGCAATTLPHCK